DEAAGFEPERHVLRDGRSHTQPDRSRKVSLAASGAGAEARGAYGAEGVGLKAQALRVTEIRSSTDMQVLDHDIGRDRRLRTEGSRLAAVEQLVLRLLTIGRQVERKRIRGMTIDIHVRIRPRQVERAAEPIAHERTHREGKRSVRLVPT